MTQVLKSKYAFVHTQKKDAVFLTPINGKNFLSIKAKISCFLMINYLFLNS